jgi:hypothetical protein
MNGIQKDPGIQINFRHRINIPLYEKAEVAILCLGVLPLSGSQYTVAET